MAKPSHSTPPVKPKKPTPDFPLFPHATKRWAKKVKGKFHYFGHWDDPQGALEEWLRVKDELINGRPRPKLRSGAYTVADVCNAFLEHRQGKVDRGEMRRQTWSDYRAACEVLIEVLGASRYAEDLRPADFAPVRDRISAGCRPKTIANRIARIRAVIRFVNKNEMTDRPISTGTYLEMPSDRSLRLDKAAQDHGGKLMFEAAQLREILDAAGQPMRAMILLAINVGVGNSDCGQLEFRHLDLVAGWLDYPRPKTGVDRRAKLWPETIDALREVIDAPRPKAAEGLPYVFITRHGKPWFNDRFRSPIGPEFVKLLERTGHYVKGVGFYSLRRTFETIAGETIDQPAVDLSMGHKSPGMAALYRQRIGDDRLEAVAEHVRTWLFGSAESDTSGA